MADWKEVLEHPTIKKLIEHLHLTNDLYVQNCNRKRGGNKRNNLAIILKDGNNDR